MTFFIKRARERAGYSQKELAKIVGVAPNTFHGYESGKHEPKPELLVKIAKSCGTSVDYLLGHNSAAQQNLPPLSSEAIKIAERFDRLDDVGRGAVRAIMDYEEGRLAASAVQDHEEDNMEYLRHYFIPAAAGYASPIEGEDYELVAKTAQVPHKADFCIDVQGDSMEPYIEDGQTVYVQRDASLNPFDVGIFFVDGDVFCKQFFEDDSGNIYLLSANPKRKSANKIIMNDSTSTFTCFGKVILPKRLPPPGYEFIRR